MNIIVTTPLDEFELFGLKGGNQRIGEALVKSINKYTKHNAVNVFIPMKFYPTPSLFKSYLANYCMDYSEYDMVISSKFPSYVTNHPNHVCYFAHACRQFYDWWPDYRKKASNPLELSLLTTARFLIHRIDHRFLKRAKKVYAYSKVLQKRLKIENDIDAELLYAPSFIENFKTGKYEYILSTSILNEDRKRISLIIKAMQYIKEDIRLLIAGDGPSKDYLKQLAGDDERIKFLGYVGEEELVELYSNALCVPFVSYIEDHGLVTIEAMMSEKPVITCHDSGGSVDFVEDFETGFVCDPNPESISEKIKYFMDNPKEAESMGKKAYTKVNGVTWKNVVNELMKSGHS